MHGTTDGLAPVDRDDVLVIISKMDEIWVYSTDYKHRHIDLKKMGMFLNNLDASLKGFKARHPLSLWVVGPSPQFCWIPEPGDLVRYTNLLFDVQAMIVSS